MLKIKPGLEVLVDREMGLVRGKRVGVVTNHSAITSDLIHIVDVLLGAGVQITALFGPEHGVRGDVADGQEIKSGKDPRTGIPVFSLYGPIKKPTPEMLRDIDVLIYDLQDAGARFYTFTYTMSYAMQACAENRKQFIVLDRPNPIGGIVVEGNILEKAFSSFVGLHPIPIRHGMTIGELALMFNNQFGIGANLEVVTIQGWKRAMWWDETGLPWVMPSPNLPTLDAVALFPGMCFLEGTNVSEARGTTKPFEMAGAPWADGHKLADRLNLIGLPGVGFRAASFIPFASKYQQQLCHGIQVHVFDRKKLRSVEVGLHVVKAFLDLFPGDFEFRAPGPSGKCHFDLLLGSDKPRLLLSKGAPVEEIIQSWEDDLYGFKQVRERYLLYS